MRCSTGSRPRSNGSGASSTTRATSCGRRSPTPRPSSILPFAERARSRGSRPPSGPAPPGGTVTIAGDATDRELRLRVLDTGPGFHDDFLQAAFEPFSRADAGRSRNDGGAGLGLAIVRAIAESHGGTVVARNLPEGGA